DAVTDQVNWSDVAARAFRAKLVEIQLRKVKTMRKADVVKRLKAAQEEDGQEENRTGKAAGRVWDERTASAKELQRVARYIQRSESQGGSVAWWDVDYPHWNAPFGAADNFVIAVWPSAKEEREQLQSFWELALGEDDVNLVEDGDFLHG